MAIHISPHSITHSSMNPSNSAVSHKVPIKSIEFCRFSMLQQYLCYAITANVWTFLHNDYVERSHMQGLVFSFRFPLLNMWPAPRVSWCCEISSGASGSILYVRSLQPTSNPCIRTECCSLELLTFGIRNPSIPANLTLSEIATRTAVLDINIYHRRYLSRTLSRRASNCILLDYVQILAPIILLLYCT